MNRGVKAGIATVCVALLGAGGYGAYNFVHAVSGVVGGGGTPAAAATEISTAAPSSADALKRAQSFLDSWHSGPTHYTGAASQTNDPVDAQTALTGYGNGLKLTSVAFGAVTASPTPTSVNSTSGMVPATKVSFTVTAKVDGGTWTYPSSLNVLQTVGGTTAVDWSSAVLYPKLPQGDSLVAGPLTAGDAAVEVVDQHGVELTAAKYPSLTDIISHLQTTYASRATGGGKGATGTGVDIVDASGSHVGNAVVFKTAGAAKLYTTIDATVQGEAERAVKDSHITGKSVGVVAIDHATGGIRAVAFSGTDGDIAFEGKSAPGSTMKIVTAATLIDQGGMGPGTATTCTPTLPVNGKLFHNMDGEGDNSGSTMEKAFEESCNTAFIHMMDNASFGNSPQGFTAQSREAANVFGLGDWSVGYPTTNPAVPQATGDSIGDQRIARAANAIGQGDVAANPLVMASIGATVAHGGFKQPVLLSSLPQAPAATPISQRTAADLRQMMVATAAYGTAAPRLAGMGSSVGAKTGTAEVDGTKPNGWFVAYDSTLSVAAEVIGADTGADTAGWVVSDILKHK
ncbi:penicillin-binding transpeptidase domain-containing protein [Streptacidiphilus cavernicola]|uniref:Penicillin-binding transpeptidase domain-containing protein n=1 Tax=Streptacidiphilus cavernicola TaxID=3342716 RepID=A0ABV6VN73_9ACTN